MELSGVAPEVFGSTYIITYSLRDFEYPNDF